MEMPAQFWVEINNALEGWAESLADEVAPFGITTTIVQNGILAFLFTALSFVRSYAIRRVFVAMDDSRRREREHRARSLERRLETGRLPAKQPRVRNAHLEDI